MNVIYFISDFSATYLLCQHCREAGFHRNFSLKEQIRDVTGSSILKGRGRNNIPMRLSENSNFSQTLRYAQKIILEISTIYLR